jgi:hypothetical protein
MPSSPLQRPLGLLIPLLATALLGMTGCTCRFVTEQPRGTSTAAVISAPLARINHVVFFDLKDPADADRLIEDCRRLLGGIPGVTGLFCGRHFESGRESVLSDYDVGLYVGLDSPDAYAAYLTHPDHLSLVEAWGPRFESYRVYDIEDRRAE